MNKMFFISTTIAVALNFVISSASPAMADEPLNPLTNLAESKLLLRAKLADLSFFSANFTQEVVSEAGELLEKSSGKLAISKPNLANWHTQEPDELAIVSDGNDVWFYNPWIEQVSVYSLSAAIAKTPILLLTSKDESLWQQYTVSKELVTQTTIVDTDVNEEGDRFIIRAKDPHSQIKSLTLVFEKINKNNKNAQQSELSQFSFLDATGQVSHIKLSKFEAKNKPESSLFSFTLPEGVQIDDQRAN